MQAAPPMRSSRRWGTSFFVPVLPEVNRTNDSSARCDGSFDASASRLAPPSPPPSPSENRPAIGSAEGVASTRTTPSSAAAATSAGSGSIAITSLTPDWAMSCRISAIVEAALSGAHEQ